MLDLAEAYLTVKAHSYIKREQEGSFAVIIEEEREPFQKLARIAAPASRDLCRDLSYQCFIADIENDRSCSTVSVGEHAAYAVSAAVGRIGIPQGKIRNIRKSLTQYLVYIGEIGVKVDVFFRGRSILYKEQGETLLARFAADLEDYGTVTSTPVLEGKRMTMFISPKKGAGRKPTPAPKPKSDEEEK